jgi:hypothetical protein
MKQRVREFVHATPFKPFFIRTAGGKQYRINHPDFIAVGGPTTPNIYIEDLRGNGTFLSALLITSVATVNRNAPRKRKSAN